MSNVSSVLPTPVTGGRSYLNVTASALAKTGDGELVGYFVASTSAGTVKLWDNTSAATTVLVNTFSPSPGWNPAPFHFKTGLYITIGGTIDLTLSFT